MPALTIRAQLHHGAQRLSQQAAPQLEAELLLAKSLRCLRTHLWAYPDQIVDEQAQHIFATLLERRVAGEPIAYLLGYQEFWSLSLKVTPDTLIPRPETEGLVELALKKLPLNLSHRVVDLGTGSGAIALALATERPDWRIVATDDSDAALAVAQHNAQVFQLNQIDFFSGFWCSALPANERFAAIVSNPPYIAHGDAHLQQGDLRFEPKTALVSGREGLDDLQHIISTAQSHLAENGWLLLEHGYQHSVAVCDLLSTHGYTQVESFRDLAGQLRYSVGKRSVSSRK